MNKSNTTVTASSIIEEISGRADRLLIPLTVLLEPTRRCNLECRHCYRIEDTKREEISLQRITNLLTELRQAGCLFLTISGGEPLLHPDFLDICRQAHSLNMAISIFTNGTLITESLIEQLAQLNIVDIHLSIYGVTSETHDSITQHKGSYNKTINAASMLKRHGLPVRFKYIMMKGNIREYKDMLGLAKQMDIPYDIDPIITPRDDGDMAPTTLSLSNEDLGLIYKDVLPPATDSQTSTTCSSGRSYCAINSYGDVYPCIQLPVPAGNIMDSAFLDIWNNSKWFREIRNFCSPSQAACAICAEVGYCRPCPGMNYLETKNIYGISNETCRHARAIKRAVTDKNLDRNLSNIYNIKTRLINHY